LQEDRAALLETGSLLQGSLEVLVLSLPRVTFDKARCRAAVDEGFTQATDLAEVLVSKGMPFRKAYQVVGSLVRRCQERGLTLAQVTPELASTVDSALDSSTLAVLEASFAVARKQSAGSTGPASVDAQLLELEAQSTEVARRAREVPRLAGLMKNLMEAKL
jgi:argininosuccinate lyase